MAISAFLERQKMNSKLKLKIDEYLSRNGESALIDLLSAQPEDPKPRTLTIIANGGVHPLQELHKRGEVFIASVGNMDFSSRESAESEIRQALINVAIKLKSEAWSKVYIVPFGPAVLSMLIKSLVYKILNQETIDILHAGSGVHFDISIDTRAIALQASSDNFKD